MTIKYKPIRILPDFIANQIAAGEVVQRPESVIKELVENSFDAGADTVLVIVKDAGKQLIHVVDNGTGMSKEDLLLSVKRHATSKVFSPEDLEEIHTYGFRGEALASIASVANIEIRTIRKGDEHGYRLVSEPMRSEVIEPFAVDKGTQIFVRNLFYNVPVRRKFLRTNITEFRYISDTMIKFALSKPDLRFIFYDEDTLIFDVKPSSLRKRIEDVMGKSTAEQIIEVQHSYEGIEISGYIGLPSIAKQTKTGQYLFLNQRSIQSKSLSHAIFSSFEHLIEKTKHPFYVLNIKLDAKKFDVNVHPQKHEVKFEDEKFIYNAMNRAVTNALSKQNLVPSIALDEISSISPFERVDVSSPDEPNKTILVNKATGEVIEPLPANPYAPSANYYKHNNYNAGQSYNNNFNSSNNYSSNSYGSSSSFKKDNFTQPEMSFQNMQNIFTPPEQKNESAFDYFTNETSNKDNTSIEKLKVLLDSGEKFSYLQVHKKYIVLESQTGIILFDQHAAHERILYEKAIRAMNREFANTQEVLFPIAIQLSASEITIVNEISADLFNLGYRFEISENQVIISGLPLDDDGSQNSFRELIEAYIEEQKLKHTNKRDAIAASFSCKAAIKTGYKLSRDEIMRLFSDLLSCDMPYCCPHGRPIIIELSLYNLDKLFGRIL